MRCPGDQPGDQPGQRLLRAQRSVTERSCAHATDRRAASRASPRRFAHAARPAGCRGEQDWPSACKDAHERMGIEAVYCRPRTSAPAPGHKIYPYLLRGLTIDRANQVWASDITYIRMARGFVYLAAVMDWSARRILAWRLSITLGVDFCIEALEEALRLYGRPDIFNSDQGSQFTSDPFTDILITRDITISMDGKGAWRDNVFVERFWRTLKYEEVYLKAYESVAEARSSIGCYLEFYNT